jgi:hypothetical protein
VTTPLAPEPDEKDWTWVLGRPCPECGFDARAVARDEVPALTRRHAATLQTALARPDAAARPEPTVWAPVEYGCHVRDVCTLFAQRLDLMLTKDDPMFDDWDQDVTALEQRYWTQDPTTVAGQLADESAAIATAFGVVTGDQWHRPGRRSNGSVFTVDTFARYFLHDLAHHAWDVVGEPAR